MYDQAEFLRHKEFTFLGVYLTLSMALTSLSVIFTVWVLKLHNNGIYQVPVPPSMRRFVLGRLARIFCRQTALDQRKKTSFKLRRREASVEHSGRLAGVHNDSELCLRLIGNGTYASNGARTRKGASLRNVNRATSKNCVTSSTQDFMRHTDNHMTPAGSLCHVSDRATSPRHHKLRKPSLSAPVHPKHALAGDHAYQSSACSGSRAEVNLEPCELERLALLERILASVTQLARKQEDDDVIEEIAQEWRVVAFVVDRALFWIFLLITVVATLFILVLVPIMRYV